MKKTEINHYQCFQTNPLGRVHLKSLSVLTIVVFTCNFRIRQKEEKLKHSLTYITSSRLAWAPWGHEKSGEKEKQTTEASFVPSDGSLLRNPKQ